MNGELDIFWMVILAAVVVAILVLNDRTKKWAADKATKSGQAIPTQHRDFQTNWAMLAFLFVAFGVYIVALNNPTWVPTNMGPLTPLIDFLLKR